MSYQRLVGLGVLLMLSYSTIGTIVYMIGAGKVEAENSQFESLLDDRMKASYVQGTREYTEASEKVDDWLKQHKGRLTRRGLLTELEMGGLFIALLYSTGAVAYSLFRKKQGV